MREGRPVDLRCVHGFATEGGGGILDQGDVIPEFHAEAAGRFDTRVRNHADQDDVANAVLLELKIEIGIREAARSPMLPDNDIARLGLEVIMNRADPNCPWQTPALWPKQVDTARDCRKRRNLRVSSDDAVQRKSSTLEPALSRPLRASGPTG